MGESSQKAPGPCRICSVPVSSANFDTRIIVRQNRLYKLETEQTELYPINGDALCANNKRYKSNLKPLLVFAKQSSY